MKYEIEFFCFSTCMYPLKLSGKSCLTNFRIVTAIYSIFEENSQFLVATLFHYTCILTTNTHTWVRDHLPGHHPRKVHSFHVVSFRTMTSPSTTALDTVTVHGPSRSTSVCVVLVKRATVCVTTLGASQIHTEYGLPCSKRLTGRSGRVDRQTGTCRGVYVVKKNPDLRHYNVVGDESGSLGFLVQIVFFF